MSDEKDNVVPLGGRTTNAEGGERPQATSDVIAPKAFVNRLTPERVEELRAQGVLVETASPVDEIILPEPGYGEQVMGTLTDEQALVFASFYHAQKEAERMSRQIGGGYLSKLGEAMQRGEEDKFLHGEGVSVEEAAEFFRMERRADYLKQLFYWTIGEQYGIHDFQIGVRTKRRIVKGKRKW